MTDQQKENMSFMDHLRALRKHLIRSVIYILVAATIAFIYKEIIFDYILLYPRTPSFITNELLCQLSLRWDLPFLCINQTPVHLINTTMTGQFTVHITVSLISGIVIAFPFIIWEIWKFIKPALYERERSKTKGFIFWVSILFFIGVLFGYYVLVPLALNFLSGYLVSTQVENFIAVTSYASTIATLTLASGLLFELPMLTFILAKLGVISPAFMRKYRRHSIVVIFIIAAIITPPDVFSQTLIAIPLMLLYEGSIVVAKFAQKKKAPIR